MLLSVVVPVYNESEGIEKFHSQLINALSEASCEKYEIIYVDDGSRDSSLDTLKRIAKNHKEIRIISFSRNFGKEMATTAGICNASGDAVVMIDADGQHPPELIDKFLAEWKSGIQVVIGLRNSNQKEGLVKKWGSVLFYRLFNSISDAELVPRSTDFRLIDREVVNEFTRFKERQRITRGLIDWLGYKRGYISFDSPPRIAGTPSYKFSQLFRLALNSFVSLSLKPLFIFGWIGLFITTLSLIFGLFILIEQFIMGDPLAIHFSGSVILGVFISFMVGILLISQAILATYVSHIHMQSQDRPLFVINKRESLNLNTPQQREI